MKVVLAEKPSVARDLANFLRANTKRDGYFEGNGYQVTWSYGHLVGLQNPEDYDSSWKTWKLETLPMLPGEFQLKPLSEGKSREQLGVITRLFRDAEEIIGATDAGREGELIFRYILNLSGCERKPIFRLWLSSLTPQAIRQAIAQIRPADDYDSLYAAAKCRSEADWLVGLNATRNYTVRFGGFGQLWSAGRVQTPVLALVVERDHEIRTFRVEPFWELITVYRKVKFRYMKGRFTKEADGQNFLKEVENHPLEILNVQKKEERLFPPRLYDLTELQRDMNRRYGLSAAQTLKIAQALYEHKFITYPRTDSRYLSTDLKPEVPKILEKLRSQKPNEIAQLDLGHLEFPSRIVNNQKVGDHHAIIPTGNVPKQLSFREQQVFEAVLTRLIAVFYPICRKELTTINADSNRVPFQARGVRVVEPGWTALYPRKGKSQSKNEDPENNAADDEQSLPEFTVGESGPHHPELRRGETKPPPHFTENTLLGAMETAGKLVDDDELKEALKERGLGTPATRAAIIETLLKRDYLSREKKSLVSTPSGQYLVAMISDENLKSAELTGGWEAKLRQIEAKKLSAQTFMQDIESYTTQIVSEDNRELDSSRWGSCPRCGREIIEGQKGYGCSGWKEGCGFVLWRDFGDREFSPEEIRTLLQRGVIRESNNEAGILVMSNNGGIVDIPVPAAKNSGRKTRKFGSQSAGRSKPKVLGTCPLCSAEVTEQPKSFGCSKWKDGCKFTIWKSIAGKRISATLAKTLLKTGESKKLKGFKSKAGKSFEAKLKLEDGEVRLIFED